MPFACLCRFRNNVFEQSEMCTYAGLVDFLVDYPATTTWIAGFTLQENSSLCARNLSKLFCRRRLMALSAFASSSSESGLCWMTASFLSQALFQPLCTDTACCDTAVPETAKPDMHRPRQMQVFSQSRRLSLSKHLED